MGGREPNTPCPDREGRKRGGGITIGQAGHGQRARQHDGTHAQGQECEAETASKIVFDGVRGVHGGRRVDG